MSYLLLLTIVVAPPTLTDVCNSAPPANGQATVNADIATPTQDPTSGRLFYSSNGQASWTELSLARMADPGYESTHMATFAIGASGTIYYYVRASNPTNIATQSPYNSGNAWPPGTNLLALAASDPTGDAVDPEGNWVDLTGAWVGYSSDKFYGSLTNNHTSWPLYTFPQPWFIYSIGFVNPEAPSDTYAFSLSYANVPGVFTTGLYLINRYAASFERIADADASTSGNRLHLRCNISDLVSHPKFGPWPNTSGYLTVAANTQAIYPIGGAALRDTTAPAHYYAVRTPAFVIGQNRAPTLTDPDVNPRSGSPGTFFVFTVTYTDADTNLPAERTVVIDGNSYYLVPGHHRYASGVAFRRDLSKFSEGWHRFFFRFNDGIGQVTSAQDSFFVGSTGLAEVCASAPSGLWAHPSPFRSRTALTGGVPGERLIVAGVDGRVVRTLAAAATGEACWDGTDGRRQPVPAGAYVVRGRGQTIAVLKLAD